MILLLSVLAEIDSSNRVMSIKKKDIIFKNYY